MISKLPRPIAVKLCHVSRILVRFTMQVQTFRGHSQKKFGAKNMQNFERRYTTSDFIPEYLQNKSRYPKSERYVIENDSSAFGKKVR